MAGSAFVVVALIAVVVVGGLIALVVGLIGAASRQETRRMDEFRAYAAARGFAHLGTDRALPARFTGPPFGRGGGRVAHHVVQGTHDGRPFVAFEYRFTTRTGDDTRHHRFGVVATALPTSVPKLELVRSSTMGTFLDAFGGGDHQVGDVYFDAAYRVFTASAPFAADVLGPDLRAWLMAQQPPTLYLRDTDLVVVAVGAQPPADVDRRLAFASAFLGFVPDRVWERAARGPGLPLT